MKNYLYPFVLIFGATIAACSPQSNQPTAPSHATHSAAQVSQYKVDLLTAINNSDKIVVTEHSHPFDNWDDKSDKSLVPNDIIYKSKEIAKGKKDDFLEIVNNLDGEVQQAYPMCIFQPHHTIQFFSKNRLLSTMEICFICDHIRWTGSKAKPPLSLYTGLEEFLKENGFNSKRDWKSLAKNLEK